LASAAMRCLSVLAASATAVRAPLTTDCIDLRSRALDKVTDLNYQLNAGPLMNQYFDRLI